MGVPVISRIGTGLPQRLSASILHSIGKSKWCARDDADYADRAVEVARGLTSGIRRKSTLRQLVLDSPSADGPRYTRWVEAAYETMWRDHERAGMTVSGLARAPSKIVPEKHESNRVKTCLERAWRT